MFKVNWPASIQSLIIFSKDVFQTDIIRLPSVSCLWQGITFFRKLQLYTLTPLVLLGLLIMPVVTGWIHRLHRSVDQVHRWHATLNKAWSNVMFVLFIIYPAVSLGTVLAINCDTQLGLLRDDYRVTCPPIDSFLTLYSFCFFVLYPFGIPIFMISSCLYMDIRSIVKEKLEKESFRAMVTLFIQSTTSVESQLFARLVGMTGDDEAKFAIQCNWQYDRLIVAQGGGDMVVLDNLEKIADHDSCMEGTDLKHICKYMRQFDHNGDGEVDRDEFASLIQVSQVEHTYIHTYIHTYNVYMHTVSYSNSQPPAT